MSAQRINLFWLTPQFAPNSLTLFLRNGVTVMRALLSICLATWLPVIACQGATLVGQPVQGGATVEIRFPVAKSFQDIAVQGGNPRPEMGRAVLMFPAGFHPVGVCPLLICTSRTEL